MPDTITRLNAALEGRYRIESELGEGGMATVYLADDLRHERKVALKVLKPELAAVVGAERFLAEIKTTANLQHPHILPLFDSGDADGFLFYVMPYVDGESLRERLDREHQLSVDDAVRIATNVAEALDYAHRQGVIHRDIKPANILLQDGKPLVSDFGIALALSAGGGSRLTETGLSLGTPHYMSPEQATGDQAVRPQTDTYALGCVLYEMLTGEPPFVGSTAQAVLGKVIQGAPVSARAVRPTVPLHVDAAVQKALERVPADRFTRADDLTRALDDPGFRHGEVAAAPTQAEAWQKLAMVAAVTAVLLAVGLIWSLARPPATQPVTMFPLQHDFAITTNGLAISRDGRNIALRGRLAEGPTQLYVRRLDQLVATPIPGTGGAGTFAHFSPDGEAIAFTTGEVLRTVRLDGGDPRTLVSDSVQSRFGGIDWAEDGMVYYRKSGRGIWRVPQGGGGEEEVTALAENDVQHAWHDVLPGARGLLMTVEKSVPIGYDLVIKPLDGGEVKSLLPQPADPDDTACVARYAYPGYLVFVTCDGRLQAVPFDLRRLEVTGSPRTLLDGVGQSPTGFSNLDVSGTGTLVYRTGEVGDRARAGVVVWLNEDGTEDVVHPGLSGVIEAPALSPDGSKVAFDRQGGGRRDIWIHDLEAGTFSRLTDGGTYNARPGWSPDGREVGFVTDRDEGQAFYARPWDRSGPARLLRAPEGNQFIQEGAWTPDGRWLLFRVVRTNINQDILYAAPHPDSAEHVLVDNDVSNAQLSLSPDGRWLAHRSLTTGRDEVYVRPFPGPGPVHTISLAGGRSPIWSRDGRRLFYVDTDEDVWMEAEVRTEPDFALLSQRPLRSVSGFADTNNIQRYDVSPSGRRLLAVRYLEEVERRDVVILSFFELLGG